jgi:glycosyltransferase involved in cell wall biosynthesis
LKKRILWIIDGLGHGGAEKMTLSLMENFNRDIFDLRICVFQMKQGNPIAVELERIGIPVDLLLVPNLRHPGNLPKLLRYIKEYKPHIIHTQLEFANILGNIAAAILGIPSVSTLHTLGASQKRREYWHNQVEWTSLRYFCSRIISVSESTRQHHIKHGNISDKKILTIYNGINLSNFNQTDKFSRENAITSLNIPKDAVVLITVAVLREPKGIQYMIEAMPKILASAPNAHYLIVGDGEYGQKLKELSLSLNMEKHITFTGQRTDIANILLTGDIFVLPTLIDALPTVLIEAMAARKPLIASNVGGVPEIIANEKNGILVEPENPQQLAESCLRLIMHKQEREAMAEAGLKIAYEKFNIVKQIEAISNLYEELAKNGR